MVRVCGLGGGWDGCSPPARCRGGGEGRRRRLGGSHPTSRCETLDSNYFTVIRLTVSPSNLEVVLSLPFQAQPSPASVLLPVLLALVLPLLHLGIFDPQFLTRLLHRE